MKRHLKKFSFLLLAALLLSACKGKSADTAELDGVNYNEIEKPDKITILTHTFSKDEETTRNITQQYKNSTGVELVVNNVSDNNYYEIVNIAIAADDKTDVVELGSVYYPSAAMYNLLWDMTDVYEQSEVKNIINEYYVDALRINGRVYGFPLSQGNGTITYVRRDWMNKLGISDPKNYTDYYNMLKAFKDSGEDIIPVTAAGVISSEAPYRTYLPEFYQDANPDIYQKNGEYIDGMTEPAMKNALERLKQAYNDGLLDPDIVKNQTSDCRNKFYAGQVAVFNYWSGNWANNLQVNVVAGCGDDALVEPIEPIEEIKYVERPPVALGIPVTCKNPEGVFKYFLEYMHDNSEGELLFSIGLEGTNYTIENNEVIPTKIGAYFTPDLSIAKNPISVQLNSTITDSAALFHENSVMEPLPAISEGSGSTLPELSVIRKETIESIVTTDMTVDEGLEDYQKRAGKMVKRALDDLNSSKSDDNEKEE